MEREQKNQMLADLYALRAGMSAISIEKDKLDKSEKNYNDAMSSLKKVSDEYNKYDYDIQRVSTVLNDFKSQGYEETDNQKQKRKSKYSKSGRIAKSKSKSSKIFMHMIITIVVGIIAAAVPWFLYFAATGWKGSIFEDRNSKYYIYISAAIFLISLIVAAARLIIEFRKHKDEKEDTKKSIRELNNELAGYQMERKLLEPKLNECYAVVNRSKAIVERDRAYRSKLSQEMYNALVAQFKSVLDIRDWEHIDLIIFNFETGRADTLKEALQQVDRRVQTDEIIEAIESAGSSIAATINVTMRELRSDLNKSFNRLSEQLAIQHAEQMTALGNINRSIERTNESIAKLQSATENNGKTLENISSAANLNNALIAKIGYDSMSLMDDVNYMVFTAPKDGGTSNTSYTLNVNVK